jgi:hypothetical protein
VSAASQNESQLQVTSQPGGATVVLDGRRRGATPVLLEVSRGTHTLVLSHPDAVDEQRQLSVTADTAVSVNMWLHKPTAMVLGPPYPGASIVDVGFIADGRLALSIAVRSRSTESGDRTLREPWIYDPAQGSLTELTTQGSTLPAAEVSISPDGHHLAYLQPNASSAHASAVTVRLTEVWVASDEMTALPVRVFTLPSASAVLTAGPGTSADVEEVHDVAWTPDGQHLLVTVRLAGIAGGYVPAPRSRLLLVDATPEQPAPAVELMTLPAEVVAGSYTWAPDGKWVAFLTEATTGSQGGSGFVALCALDTAAGGAISGFRYVADLGHLSDPSGPLPVAAAAWSLAGDGRLVYTAATPKITVSNPLGLPTTSGGESGLFVGTPAGQALTAEEGSRLGSVTGLIAPAWPSAAMNGANLIALTHSQMGNRPLVVRGVDPVSGVAQNLDIALPTAVGGTGPVAARWDLSHGRLLVLARHDNSSSGQLDYWLVQLRADMRAD